MSYYILNHKNIFRWNIIVPRFVVPLLGTNGKWNLQSTAVQSPQPEYCYSLFWIGNERCSTTLVQVWWTEISVWNYSLNNFASWLLSISYFYKCAEEEKEESKRHFRLKLIWFENYFRSNDTMNESDLF